MCRIKPFRLIALATGILFSGCNAYAAAEIHARGGPGPRNPKFEEWLVAKRKGEDLLRFNGLVPSPTEVASAPKRVFRMLSASSLPRRHDPRENGAKLVPIRDQGMGETCWAHAGIATLEISSLMAEGRVVDFSESHVVNNQGYDCDGWKSGEGNSDMVQAYLLRWQGPILETYEPYPSQGAVVLAAPARHVQNVCHVAAKSSALDNDAIKNAILKYGALAVAYYHGDNYYSWLNNTYYCPYSHDTSHLVAVVGWDDDFPRTKFLDAPVGDGAYIVRNSWGPSWGDGGYFYVSYYDAVFAHYRMYAFVADEYPDNYGRCYQYDTYGCCGNWGWEQSSAWGANIFTAETNESVIAVGFYAFAPNTSYEVRVYTGCTAGMPMSGTKNISQSGTFEDAGYHTVKLGSEISITKGTLFSIVVHVDSPGELYPLALEWREEGYTSRVTASAGESFVSKSAQTWFDCVKDNGCVCNFCAKAYTKASQRKATSDSTGFVPYSWIDDFPDVLTRFGGNYESAAAFSMANGRPLYESYVALLDPNDRGSAFKVGITMENGKPHVTCSPYRPDKRKYVIQGKSALDSSEQWAPLDVDVHHYFRATVAVP